LREKKKELRELKKNLSQSREAAKASGSQTERTTISLRLCVFARGKKNNWRASSTADLKTPSRKESAEPRNSAGQANLL
jgi:hypothetical protein